MWRSGGPGDRGLESRAEKTAAARGVAWGGIETATSAIVGLVLTPMVVRACGIEGLGLWGASWSLAHTAHLLDLGVGSSYTRFTSKAIVLSDTAGLNRILGAGMGFHLALGTLLSALAILCGPRALGLVASGGPLDDQAATVFGCTLATVVLRTVLSGYRGVVAGAQQLHRLGRIGSAVSLLEGCGAALALACGFGLRGMAINSLCAAGLASLLEALSAHRLVPGLRPVPFVAGPAEWRELLSFGMRIQIVRASEILGAHVPRLLLAGGAGLAAAGLYDLGAKIAGILQLAALPLPVIQPLAGRLEARGEDQKLGALVRRATRYVALLAIPCLALVLLDAEAVLLAWTGRDIPPEAATAARLIACAAALGFLLSPLRLVLRGMGRPGPEARAALAGSLSHLGLAAALAAPYAAGGVAVAALFGATLSAAIFATGAFRIAPHLVRRTGLAIPAPVLAGVGGLLACGALRLAVLGGPLPLATRTAALTRLLPEGLALFSAMFLLSVWLRAITREDLTDLAGALPGAGRFAVPHATGPSGPHSAISATGPT